MFYVRLVFWVAVIIGIIHFSGRIHSHLYEGLAQHDHLLAAGATFITWWIIAFVISRVLMIFALVLVKLAKGL